ncbi:MAG: SDR family oxidoreductase [Anaerolineae bacterium]
MPDALIWGASGGIGSALVRVLKQAGWRVFAAARDVATVPAEADHAYAFDAANPTSISQVEILVAHETEGLDLVVYAAGDLRAELLKKQSADDWSAVLDANLNGAFLAASKSLYILKPDGHMFFMGAYIDHVTLPKMGAYAVAKAGLAVLVEVLRKENRKQRFSLVRPGAVDTAFWEAAPFKKPANIKPPEAVATAILAHFDAGQNTDLDLPTE